MSLKIFISDIHLSDTTTGVHNISLETLEGFWNDIKSDVENANGTKELIVLGDFIDVIRSTKWNGDIQPWNKIDDIKNVVDGIVKDIYKKNAQVFDRFKGFVEAGLSITYIMGNHDRLINSDGYDDIRKYIQEKLGLIPTGQKFPWKYSVDGLPIYAVHGNDFDIYNKTENSSLPIGDAIVTLLINQYPEEVKKALEEKNAPNVAKVYKSLQEIDNLRPSTVTPYWIDYVKKSLQPDDQSLLVDTWNNLSEEFFDNGFVKDWFQKNDYWSFLPDDADKLEIAFRHFTDTKLGRAYEKFLEIKKDFIKETDQNAAAALKLINSNKCDYVLFGHTHESAVHLLDVEGGKEKYYINTGTWRNRVVPGGYKKKGIVFGHQESIDYVMFKIDDSEIKEFQLWNGTLHDNV